MSSTTNRVGRGNPESPLFESMRTESQPEAELAVRRGLRSLRRRDDQRMPWVDRHHRGPHAQARHRPADHRGQGHRIEVEVLRQPHHLHTRLVSATRLLDGVVDDVGCATVR